MPLDFSQRLNALRAGSPGAYALLSVPPPKQDMNLMREALVSYKDASKLVKI